MTPGSDEHRGLCSGDPCIGDGCIVIRGEVARAALVACFVCLRPRREDGKRHSATICAIRAMRQFRRGAVSAPTPEARCHWDDCPHGADCVHAQPSGSSQAGEQR